MKGVQSTHTHTRTATHTEEVFMHRVAKRNFLCGQFFSRRSSFQLSSALPMTWQTGKVGKWERGNVGTWEGGTMVSSPQWVLGVRQVCGLR